MADVIGLSDVSSKDTGKGSKLKTGNLKRGHNMPKACVDKLIKQGKTPAEAHKLCYPKKSKYPSQSEDKRKGSAYKEGAYYGGGKAYKKGDLPRPVPWWGTQGAGREKKMKKTQ